MEKKRPVFGGEKVKSLSPDQRKSQAAKLAPILRGLASSEKRMVGTFSDSDVVLQFVNSHDLTKLAPMGTSCPDHFLRTKISPLVLELAADADLSDTDGLKEKNRCFIPSLQGNVCELLPKTQASKQPCHARPESSRDSLARSGTF